MLGRGKITFALLLLSGAPISTTAAILANAAFANPIPGYLDPKTNSFTPLPHSATSTAPATAGVSIKGTIVVEVVAKVDPSIPPDAIIGVTIALAVKDDTRSGSVSTQTQLNRHGNSVR